VSIAASLLVAGGRILMRRIAPPAMDWMAKANASSSGDEGEASRPY
jgi:hypothetical protein